MITAVIQARSTSTRLPGKCLKLMDGVPLWYYSYSVCKSIMPTIVCYPDGDSDMKKSLIRMGLTEKQMYHGSLNDVLLRYVKCMEHHKLDAICRVTSDCPLISPAEIMYLSSVFMGKKLDFITNVMYAPDGQDVEIISNNLLLHIQGSAFGPEEREHVTIYIKKHWEGLSAKWKLESTSGYPFLKRMLPKLSIDTENDFFIIEKYLQALHKIGVDFGDGHNRGGQDGVSRTELSDVQQAGELLCK